MLLVNLVDQIEHGPPALRLGEVLLDGPELDVDGLRLPRLAVGEGNRCAFTAVWIPSAGAADAGPGQQLKRQAAAGEVLGSPRHDRSDGRPLRPVGLALELGAPQRGRTVILAVSDAA